MIFFSEKKLATTLRAGEVTRNQFLVYLIIVLVCVVYSRIYHLISVLVDPDLVPFRSIAIATSAFGLCLDAILIFYAYRINAKGDGRDFLNRCICLSVPIGIKAIGVIFIISAPYFHYKFTQYFHTHPNWMSEVEKPSPDKLAMSREVFGDSYWIPITLYEVILAFFWAWRLNVSFKIASGQTEDAETGETSLLPPV